MTIQDAYAVLDQSTQPQNQGRITREGYVQIQQALDMFAALIKAQTTPRPQKPEPPTE